MTRVTVREIGEFGLIEALRDALPPAVTAGPGLEIGIGDDCAVWRPPDGEAVVVTTDSLVEDVHFRLDWTDWASLGHKTLAVNLSDLASMGARPGVAVLTLGLRGSESVDDLLALYRGVGDLAERAGILVAGGDLVASPTCLTIHVTAMGTTRGGRALRRSGARAGDVLGVSGSLGASSAGLALLGLNEDDPRRKAATADLLIAAHLRPEPRIALGEALLRVGATAAMDLSDGLFGDLPKMLAASGVSARIEEAAIPVPAAVRALFPDRWLEMGTRGGEDYELLFSAPLDVFAEIEREAPALGSTVARIGRIEASPGRPRLIVVDRAGAERIEAAGAFDHFAASGV